MSYFGTDTAGAIKHYNEFAIAEGREITFDATQYLANNADLAAFFSSANGYTTSESIIDGATRHYIEYGFAEGRTATSTTTAETTTDHTTTDTDTTTETTTDTTTDNNRTAYNSTALAYNWKSLPEQLNTITILVSRRKRNNNRYLANNDLQQLC